MIWANWDHLVLFLLTCIPFVFAILLVYARRQDSIERQRIEMEIEDRRRYLREQQRQEPYWQMRYGELLAKYEGREKAKNDHEVVGLTEDGEMIYKEKNGSSQEG